MQCFQGKSVYKGIVMGPVAVLKKNDYQVKRSRGGFEKTAWQTV